MADALSASIFIGETVSQGTTGSILFVDSNGHAAQNNASLFWDNTNLRQGILTTTPQATLHVGASQLSTTDTMVLVSRVASAQSDHHGFAEWSTITSTGGNGYGVFDSAVSYTGAGPWNHIKGFQHRATMASTGTLTDMIGFDNGPAITAAGTITNVYGLRARNVSISGGGTVVNQYGFYSDTLAGASTNWAIYVSNNNSYFSGFIGVGTQTPRRQVDIFSTTQPQLRLTYTDNTVFTLFTRFSCGNTTEKNTGGTYFINGPTATTINFIIQTNGTNKALHGIAGSAGAIIANSAQYDFCLRAETQNILFSTTAGGLQGIMTTGGFLGWNTATPRRLVDLLDAANPQLRLTQADNTVYTDLQTNASGQLLINSTSGAYFFNAPVATNMDLIFQINSITRAFVALAGAAGGIITGSAAKDLCIRTETQNLLFSTTGGGVGFKMDTNTTFYTAVTMATNMTTGFFNMPGAAGPPTGVPATTTGFPYYFDSLNNKLYIYSGTWKKGQVTGVDVVYA